MYVCMYGNVEFCLDLLALNNSLHLCLSVVECNCARIRNICCSQRSLNSRCSPACCISTASSWRTPVSWKCFFSSVTLDRHTTASGVNCLLYAQLTNISSSNLSFSLNLTNDPLVTLYLKVGTVHPSKQSCPLLWKLSNAALQLAVRLSNYFYSPTILTHLGP